MARKSEIPRESFDELLAWLDPDRDVAAQMYLQLRQDLGKIFMWNRCADPEGLTDEVFDRVARKVHEVKVDYVGNPRLYFRAVANNLIKETHKKVKTHASLSEVDLPQPETVSTAEDTADIVECLESCLRQLTDERRKLILEYYAKEKQAKIDQRHELAKRLKISLENLRVKVFRIRGSLEECIQKCLECKTQLK